MRTGVLRLRVGPASVYAKACHGSEVTWAGEASYQSLDVLTEVIARLASEPAARCRHLSVTLERPPAQVRTLADLPPVKDRELTALVAQQQGRYFRRNGHPLVTDAVWIGKGKSREARAAAVEEPVVEAIAAGARAAGLLLDVITPADLPVALQLLPSAERAARLGTESRRLRRLAFAAALTWTVALGLLAGRLVWECRAVERELTALQPPLTAVLAARHELRDAEATMQAVAAAEADRSQALRTLSAVTSTIPDSAVVTSLAWSVGDSGLVAGFARRTSDVLGRMERSKQFPSARLVGPVAQESIADHQWERFTIQFGRERAPP